MLTYKLKERTGKRRTIETVNFDPEVWTNLDMNTIKAKMLNKLTDRWGLEITESQGRLKGKKAAKCQKTPH